MTNIALICIIGGFVLRSSSAVFPNCQHGAVGVRLVNSLQFSTIKKVHKYYSSCEKRLVVIDDEDEAKKCLLSVDEGSDGLAADGDAHDFQPAVSSSNMEHSYSDTQPLLGASRVHCISFADIVSNMVAENLRKSMRMSWMPAPLEPNIEMAPQPSPTTRPSEQRSPAHISCSSPGRVPFFHKDSFSGVMELTAENLKRHVNAEGHNLGKRGSFLLRCDLKGDSRAFSKSCDGLTSLNGPSAQISSLPGPEGHDTSQQDVIALGHASAGGVTEGSCYSSALSTAEGANTSHVVATGNRVDVEQGSLSEPCESFDDPGLPGDDADLMSQNDGIRHEKGNKVSPKLLHSVITASMRKMRQQNASRKWKQLYQLMRHRSKHPQPSLTAPEQIPNKNIKRTHDAAPLSAVNITYRMQLSANRRNLCTPPLHQVSDGIITGEDDNSINTPSLGILKMATGALARANTGIKSVLRFREVNANGPFEKGSESLICSKEPADFEAIERNFQQSVAFIARSNLGWYFRTRLHLSALLLVSHLMSFK